MQVDIIPAHRVAELREAYNAHATRIPLSDPVSEAGFTRLWSWRDEGSARLEGEQVCFAATDGDAIVGFAHVAVGRFPGPELYGDQNPGPTGVIRCLTHLPGRREAGQRLLDAARHHLAERAAGRILAFPNNGYPFQRFAYGELPDLCGHVRALLLINGFRAARGEVFMHWRDYGIVGPPVSGVEGDVFVEHANGVAAALPSVVVTARLDGRLVGVCEGHSLGLSGESAAAHETVVLGPMDVESDFRGQGWGKLLSSKMLAEARALGYRHSATSTQEDNHRAQLLYLNLGYVVTDVAHSYLIDP